ncbi:hypothetical protein PybrP1_005234 [[Pythium] brassicae (nom. inval.)]|nr:hypothetical protein PybrP1_005234 [[Pythium] brassicae (nom. inval.)]
MANRDAQLLPGQIDDDSIRATTRSPASSPCKVASPNPAFRLVPELKPSTQPQPPPLPSKSPSPPSPSTAKVPSVAPLAVPPRASPRVLVAAMQAPPAVVVGPITESISEEEQLATSRSSSHEQPGAASPSLSPLTPRRAATTSSSEPGSGIVPASQYRRQTYTKSSNNLKPGGRAQSRRLLREGSDLNAKLFEGGAIAEDGAGADGRAAGDAVDEADDDDLVFELPELNEDGDPTGRTVKEAWPPDQIMLLYMLSRYAVCARTAREEETWIRQTPLLVLMYEGIASGALNFDYAPAAIVIAQEGRPKRIWMNTTQDGKSAIDDLREANLINGLKLSTKEYHSVTAFQVSLRGLDLLAQVSKELKANVDAFIFAPKPYRRELLEIRYIPIEDEVESETVLPDSASTQGWTLTGSNKQLSSSAGGSKEQQEPATAAADDSEFNEQGRFILESVGYFRYSEVTETEDVSYVSSPFVPQCVRGPEAYQPLSSNAHRAHEAASGQSNIRDTLSEAIVLANPVCLVGEWIPFGSNQIVALNERLGSMDRCQGGLFTSLIDDRPTDTQFEVPPGLTEVRILDYDPVRYINFEAEINFPEDDGIVQVENFGIHLNVDGTIFYGIKVDAILDKRSDRISVDLLSRLLVDIHQDSSEIMDDLLSSYQNSLLDMVFTGDVANRGKFNMILADQIDPFMPGLEYMDRGDFENELKQVLGDIHCAYDIGDDSVLIVGRDGMLIAGSACRRFEKVFIAYFSLLCREMFLRSFFTRIFVLEELLKRTREMLFSAKENPNHIVQIRTQLNQAANDLILFTDTLGYLIESLEFVKIPVKSANACEEEEAIFSYLDLKKQHHDILLRARDLEKLVHGAKYEIVNLRQMAEVLNTSLLEEIFKSVESNTKVLADSAIVVKQSGSSLEMVQLLLAGSFAFTLLDRIPGGSLNIELPAWVDDVLKKGVIDVPFLFFALNMLWMLLCVRAVFVYKQRRTHDEEFGRHTLRVKVNKPIRMSEFEAFLGTKKLEKQESVSQPASELRRVMWRDVSGESAVRVSSSGRLRKGSSKKQPATVRQRAKLFLRSLWRAVFGKGTAPTGNSISPLTPPGAAGNGNSVGGAAGSSAAVPQVLEDGVPVEVEVEYDSRYGYLLFVTFQFHVRKKQPPSALTRSVATALGWLRALADPSSKRKAVAKKQQEDAARKQRQEEALAAMDATTKLEEELMTWFAAELKLHKAIKNVNAFLGISDQVVNALPKPVVNA